MDNLLTWQERLNKLKIEEFLELNESDNESAIYSAAYKIRQNDNTAQKRFSIRRGITKRYVMRVSDAQTTIK